MNNNTYTNHNTTNNSQPHILVVDDDEVYCNIMKRTGEMNGFKVTTVSLLENMLAPESWTYDVAIIDYHLQCVNALELADYLRHFGCSIPILMISNSTQKDSTHWPREIKAFLHKSIGPRAILDASLQLGRKNF